jgi:hypothetical protein
MGEMNSKKKKAKKVFDHQKEAFMRGGLKKYLRSDKVASNPVPLNWFPTDKVSKRRTNKWLDRS